jgi:ABC-type multidrug transport system fused ATPase/permease subunit
MKVLRNCILSVRLTVKYASWNALLYILVCLMPGIFSGMRVILVQRLVDGGMEYGRTGQGMAGVLGAGCILVTMLFIWFLFERLQGYEDKVLEIGLIRKMAPDILAKLDRLEYGAFESSEVQGVLQRIGGEPWLNVKGCFIGSIGSARALVSIFFTLGVYARVSPWIGAGIFLVAVPMLMLNFTATKRLQTLLMDTTMEARRLEDLKRLLQDRNAMYEMKVFGSQELIAEKWRRFSGSVEDETRKAGRRVLLLEGSSRFLNITYFVFVVITLAYLFLRGSVTIGQFAAVIGSLHSITGQMHSAAWTVTGTMRSALDVGYYREFLALPERGDRRNVESLAHGDIAFENVSFTYPGTDRQVLKNLTFRIRAGERVAFVGENGAGKSTLVKLLCGLYEPDAGRVLIGGVDVRDLSEPLRKKCLSVVFQDFQEYELTLRENVALGNVAKLGADEEIRRALEQSGGAQLYLREEKGLDCSLGHLEEDGRNLSRGQWQRVAIARAFLADAAFCILDEPTAALDPIAESRMYENFARIFHKNGTIMISHRLASARLADRILVLDGGRIVQDGSHEQLMETEGLYRTMYLAQSSWYAEDGEAVESSCPSEARKSGRVAESPCPGEVRKNGETVESSCPEEVMKNEEAVEDSCPGEAGKNGKAVESLWSEEERKSGGGTR